MSGDWREAINAFIERKKGFEVSFRNGQVVISEVKGVSKTKIKTTGLRSYRVKTLLKSQLELLKSLSGTLIDARIPFKVTLGPNEFILRFNLDRYVRVHAEGVSCVGFKDEREEPLSVVVDKLKGYGALKLLKPL
ncbi:MAG: hypothetical protein QXK12_05110 [Candidatus Nezhaarchaeales archaeon]